MRLEADERVFAYVRTLGHVRAWVVLNFSTDVVEVDAGEGGLGLPLVPGPGGLSEWSDGCHRVVLGNYDDGAPGSGPGPGPGTGMETKTLALRGYEARVYIKY